LNRNQFGSLPAVGTQAGNSLELLAPPFLSREKMEKDCSREKVKGKLFQGKDGKRLFKK
jgi:hypothetical protein